MRPLRPLGILAVLLALVLLAGCGSSGSDKSDDTTAGSTGTDFPVTIDSAFGPVTIEKAPTRVATWGWSTQDAVLALGVTPVAMPSFSYGGNADGVLPWDAEALAKLGGAAPAILDSGDNDQIPFEEFAKAAPDVILAPYSGLTKAQYQKLSQIAPVVAYPDKPWATTWQDQTRIVGKALGKSTEADALVKQTSTEVAALGAKYPALQGKTFLYGAANEAGILNVYRPSDPRVQLLTELGLKVSPSVSALDTGDEAASYFYQLSYENLGRIDTDLLVAYFDDQKAADAFAKTPVVARMASVKAGHFAPIVGQSFVMASSAPTVLAIPWMLDRYVPQLAAAAAK